MRSLAFWAVLLVATAAFGQSPGTLTLPAGLQLSSAQVNVAVNAALGLKADTASPAFTGNLTSVTGMSGDQFNLTKNYSTALSGDPHQQVNRATLSVPAIAQLWNNFDDFIYNVPGGDASPLSAVLTRYIQMQKQTDSPLVPTWPLIVSNVDFTNHPSSVAGPAIGMELDLEVSGLDDQGSPFNIHGSRSMLAINARRGRSYGGADSEANVGISVFSNPAQFSFKRVIDFATTWSVAALNLAGGIQKPGASTILLAAGQTIAFDAAATRTLSYDAGTGKLFFAVSGVNKWSVDASGNVRAAGTVTGSVTP